MGLQGGATFTHLLQVDEYADMALQQFGREAEVGAKHQVHRIFTQPILGEADLSSQTSELVAEITRMVDKPQRMDISLRLQDNDVDRGHWIH